ncbi:MAG TPA: hypothetical protein VEW45_05125 [Candidatus Dormibacteraeota bacterium]|nr:hypothetical protein [Candidatus Dormibacteraeota bacterium]
MAGRATAELFWRGTMNRLRRLTIAATLSLTLVSVPATSLAATDVTYGLGGSEISATSSTGIFVGVAGASDDAGFWQATVVHGPLPTAVGSSAAVVGGNFALNGWRRDLGGAVTGGSIKLLTTSSCGKQTYDVVGSVAVNQGATGTASFGTVLTHYRLKVWGRCITYGATVKGSVSFHLQ